MNVGEQLSFCIAWLQQFNLISNCPRKLGPGTPFPFYLTSILFGIFIFNWNLPISWFHTNPPNSPLALIVLYQVRSHTCGTCWQHGFASPEFPWFLEPHGPETGPPPPARTITSLHFTPNTLTWQFWANHFPLLISYLVIILSSALVSPTTTLKIALKKNSFVFSILPQHPA